MSITVLFCLRPLSQGLSDENDLKTGCSDGPIKLSDLSVSDALSLSASQNQKNVIQLNNHAKPF